MAGAVPKNSMYEFLTKSTIRSGPQVVWEVLTNAPGYAEWNPEIVAIEGRMALGERIRAQVKVGSGAIRTVPLRVTAFDPPKRMEWTGGLPLSLFTGRRIFTVTPGDREVEFRMLVQMSGPLAALMVKAVGDRQVELDAFSSALKARVEQIEAANTSKKA
jgi:uncharacterized protein YndB with AHSA1/START domain